MSNNYRGDTTLSLKNSNRHVNKGFLENRTQRKMFNFNVIVCKCVREKKILKFVAEKILLRLLAEHNKFCQASVKGS